MWRRRFFQMAALLVLVAAVQQAMAQPVVTFSGLPKAGLILLPASSSEFQALVHPADGFRDLLPYTTALKNNGDKEVIAFHIQWDSTDFTGKVVPWHMPVFDFSSFSPGRMVLPGKAFFVVAGIGSGDLGWNRFLPQEVEEKMAFFAKQLKIAVRLEAALFADGEAVGPDPDHWISKWKATIDAERDVYTAAAEFRPEELDSKVQPWIDAAFQRAQAERRGETIPDLMSLQTRALFRSATYEDCYALLRGFFSLRLIEAAGRKGAAATIAEVGTHVKSTTYPVVHRKE